MAVTPNMHLNLPSVTTTPGPTWATLINAALGTGGIDSHDHTSGRGVAIPSAGLDIDAELTFNSFDATDLRTARFTSQTNTLAETTDLSCVYSVGGDLYWNNGSGTAVRITNGSALSATSLGGISNLPSVAYPNASVAFEDAGANYVFENATNTPAPLDSGPITLREVTTSPLGVTLASPASLAGAYTLTMLAALPAATSFLTVSSSGQLASGPAESLGIDTANIATGAVTRAKMAAVGQQTSSSCSTFSTASTSYVDVTNLSVAITTTGRPVVVSCIPDEVALFSPNTSLFSTTSSDLYIYLLRTTSGLTTVLGQMQLLGQPSGTYSWPPSAINTVDVPSSGTHTYSVQVKSSAGATVYVYRMRLRAYEL